MKIVNEHYLQFSKEDEAKLTEEEIKKLNDYVKRDEYIKKKISQRKSKLWFLIRYEKDT